MTLKQVLAAVHAPEAADLLAPYWEESRSSLPSGTPEFLTPGFCMHCREYASFPAELDAALVDVAKAISGDSALTQLAWHCAQLLYRHRDYAADKVRHWPSLEQALGDNHALFYVITGFNPIPLTRQYHESRGIPDAITRNTVRQHHDLSNLRWDAEGRRWRGSAMSLYWTRWHAWGALYGLGRLEYMVRPFGGRVQAYRHHSTREVVALATDGVRFGRHGYCDLPADSPEMLAGFTSSLTVTASTVTGHTVSPLGRATGEVRTLSLDQWELALAPGHPVLDTHIPAGGGMTPERCHDSMRQALEFFPRYFPERPFVGFGCASWILNPDHEEMLGPESNMAKWERELYLFPWPSGPREGLAAAFDEIEPPDLAKAPRDTRLRRAMLERLESGGRLRVGGMFLLTEDFERYGQGVYRNQ